MSFKLNQCLYTKIREELAKVPMNSKINRKFLISGPPGVGKTGIVQKTFNFMREMEGEELKVAGWKSGDLRYFKLE